MIARICYINIPVLASCNGARGIQSKWGITVSAKDLISAQADRASLIGIHRGGCLRWTYAVVPNFGGHILTNIESHLVGGLPRGQCHGCAADRLRIFCIVTVKPDIEDAFPDLRV